MSNGLPQFPQNTKYNELEYEVEIYIDSGGSSDSRFIINPNSIVSLNIENTLADWVTKGSLSVYYSHETMENPSKTAGALGQPLNSYYFFRNDGNDILSVRIFPNLKKLTQLQKLNVDRVHWELVYKFAIYDVEDIDNPPGATNMAKTNTKCKKFYFWDRCYQRMITNTMEYSTALSDKASSGSGRTSSTQIGAGQVLGDNFRSIYTGEAMKEVIEKALLKDNPFIDFTTTKNNLVGGGKNDSWEKGDSKIFYTAPATATAYDSLMTIYNRHVSSEKISSRPERSAPRGGTRGPSVHDFAILTKERGPNIGNEGYFALRPLSQYYKKAGRNEPGEYSIERFFISGVTSNDKPGAKIAPKSSSQNLQKDTKLGDYSMIKSYRFVDISPLVNSTQFCTRSVCSFDFSSRTYHVEFQNNSVLKAREFMSKKYIDNLFRHKGLEEELFLLTLEQSKQGRNIKPVFSLAGENKISRQADGFHKILKTGIFQNTCIHFRVYGSTNREVGRFIIIDKEQTVEDNAFNTKFYGQWFIINVQHIFEGGLYFNDITAVKINRVKPFDAAFAATI
jgi:hypothetical protein